MSAGAADILRVENLKIGFLSQGTVNEVINDVSFRIPAGKTVALVGESGSGKSVISQAIMGLLPANGLITGGKIKFQDAEQGAHCVDIAQLPRNGAAMRELRGGRIGMIFQEPMSSLSPVHTIGNQIDEALRLHRKASRKEAREITQTMLRMVGFRNPAGAYNKYPFELSGGLRQRAMMSMALICHPSLLIADEPTTALDVTVQAQVLKLMGDLQKEIGMAILLITHDLGVVANVADEVVVIYHGQIMESGSLRQCFGDPQHPYLQALMRALPKFDMGENDRLVALREVKRDPQARAALLRARPNIHPSGPLLRVQNISKSYLRSDSGFFGSPGIEEIRAVDDVSFHINKGECLGLVGESGSGKTSVSKLIMRAVQADSGSILYDDGEIKADMFALDKRALRQFRPHVQMIFQDPVSSLSPRMNVLNIICEPMEIHGIGTPKSRKERAVDLMRAVGLDPRFLNRYPHSFSGGQRQRIGIARALALSPSLIICDEPVSALDVSVQAQVLNLLKDLQRDLGLAYLFITHNLAVVDYIATRIAVMARGRIVEIAPRSTLFHEPAHPYTRALLRSIPFPELDRRLDFDAVCSGNPTDRGAWGDGFRPDGEIPLHYLDLGGGHLVLTRETRILRGPSL
ncbi:ABC transporter ATP-binding protein [Methylovirgula sp. 4M-Z18]|uniref:ABC transporter ATP-binding protein n=1 Tax=Methylovirgula sp. 4M-Z18 TaxID=2293567 RepID=UPI000E2FD078|nr:ABC transporter ATP-binding protein [Methylovirgula sp. 4M-Z18]RFB79665.1 ABC transporter ATP-binding protein [Methylovirgula sp. 4M-Z18]